MVGFIHFAVGISGIAGTVFLCDRFIERKHNGLAF